VPRVKSAKLAWKRRVLWLDAIGFGLLLVGLLVGSIYLGYWEGIRFNPPWLETVAGSAPLFWTVVVLALGLLGGVHMLLRRAAAKLVIRDIRRDASLKDRTDWVVRAFSENTKLPRPVLWTRVAGWSGSTRKKLNEVRADADRIVQSLNDRFTSPSGDSEETGAAEQREEPEAEKSAGSEASLPPPRETESGSKTETAPASE